MEQKFNDLQLVDFLRRNLTFGCIRELHLHISSFQPSGNEFVNVSLIPFSAFSEIELSIIRRHAIESRRLKNLIGVSLQNLELSSERIEAVYLISK